MDEPFEDEASEVVVEVILGPDCPSRLDKALSQYVPEEASLSRSRLAKLIAEGAVSRLTPNGEEVVTDQKAKVAEGDHFLVRPGAPQELETVAEDIALCVVYEDAELIVIDKPAGMVVHPAPGSPSGTLVNALLHHCGDTLSGIGGAKRPGIVHRIDKETSGLLVVAKTDRAHHGLAAQFEAHSVTRHYLAVCNGLPLASDPRLKGLPGISFESAAVMKIATNLNRHRTDRQRQAVCWPPEGRHAVTRARVIEAFAGQATLVECWLETGRTHQIRVHMSYCGHGLVGDPTYGGRRKLSEKLLGAKAVEMAADFPRQALHAASLGFEHPVTGEYMEFRSELPPDMTALIEAMRQGVLDAAK